MNPIGESIQNLVGDAALEKARTKILGDLKRDVGLRLLYLSPALEFVEMTKESLSEFSGMSTEAVSSAILEFLRAGIWIELPEGGIQLAQKDFLRLSPSTAREHLSATLGIISNLSAFGPCWYESAVVATNQETKKDFYRAVNAAFREFAAKSAALDKFDSVVAWSHQGYDCRDGWNKIQEGSDHVQ